MNHLGPAVLVVDLVGINGRQIREQLPVIIFAALASTIEVSLNQFVSAWGLILPRTFLECDHVTSVETNWNKQNLSVLRASENWMFTSTWGLNSVAFENYANSV